jgi:predicted TIM-barrel fold metal-dependent hydrolase
MPAVDSHAHVFAPGHPFAADVPYVPHPSQQGTAAAFRAVLDAHGLTHGLLVAAQPYLYDNTCLLRAIAASRGRFKGIALVRPGASEHELAALAAAGVIGVRFNLSSFGMREFVEPGAERLLAQMRELGWFLQIHCERDELIVAMPILRRARVQVMIDHFGRPDIALGIAQPGFAALLELGRSGDNVVKLSGAFRSSRAGYPYADVEPFIAAAIGAFTLERCVWGSDWPFVRTEERIDYGPLLACLPRWLPDEADRRRLLWNTPARLFGFQEADDAGDPAGPRQG